MLYNMLQVNSHFIHEFLKEMTIILTVKFKHEKKNNIWNGAFKPAK